LNQTTETTGRTLDDAKNAAAAALGVSVDELEFEVVEESAKGLFAKTNFKVRATMKSSAEPQIEKPSKTGRAKKTSPKIETQEDAKSTDAEDVSATKEDGKIAESVINDVLKLTGLNVSAKVADITGKYINIDLSGKDVDAFLGEEPAIDSLQYLTNAMFGRKHPNGTRLTLDAGDHRSKRTAVLEKLANDVAQAVLDRKQEAVLDPLPAHERRIIHNVLRDIDGVETYSEGEEPARRIVISPKK
jgi:spoIIIJ-associated protein